MPLLLQTIQKLYQENSVWPEHMSWTGWVSTAYIHPLYPAWTLASLQFQWTPTSLQILGHRYQLVLPVTNVLPRILHMPNVIKINPTLSGKIVRNTPLHRVNPGEMLTITRIRLRKRKPAVYQETGDVSILLLFEGSCVILLAASHDTHSATITDTLDTGIYSGTFMQTFTERVQKRR